MAGITLDEETLYYQYLINNNSTSTMLNAISGNYADNSSLSALSSIASLGSLGTLDSLSSLGSLGSLGSVSSFASILQNCLSGSVTDSLAESTEAGSMAEKLSSVLEEAAETEDTSSLTYKTVQELYEYFSEQVSSKASALLGSTASQSSTQSAAVDTQKTSTIDQMNQAALQGQELDFSEIDNMVEAAFAEQTPWA